jgi:hypothetical protein
MNKQIILSALQSQLETVRVAAIAHEENVFSPSLLKLQSKIKVWFDTNIMDNIHDITIESDRITIKPCDTTEYGNTISIDYRSGWRSEGGYFETSAYRPDLKSNEDCSNAIFYYKVMAAIALNWQNVCNKYNGSWLPAFNKMKAAKSEKYAELSKIENEIRNCEREIATLEKEVYNQSGFECTLKDWTEFNSTRVDGEYVYAKNLTPHNIKAQYGRGRWDYYYINSFKVISFPKAKHAKVVLEYKQGGAEKVCTAELNKQRYAEFINEVYAWNSSRAEKREVEIDEKIAIYNKVDA